MRNRLVKPMQTAVNTYSPAHVCDCIESARCVCVYVFWELKVDLYPARAPQLLPGTMPQAKLQLSSFVLTHIHQTTASIYIPREECVKDAHRIAVRILPKGFKAKAPTDSTQSTNEYVFWSMCISRHVIISPQMQCTLKPTTLWRLLIRIWK